AMEISVFAIHPNLEVGFLDENGALLRATLQLSGQHNLQNAKTAIAVGKYFKVPGLEIVKGLAGYRSSNHRSQMMKHRDVHFYWDAYNANPSSVEAALAGFSADHVANDAVVILGEMLELGEVTPAAHRQVALRAGQVARTVVLVGSAMKAVAEEIERPWFADSDQLAKWFWRQDWTGKTVFVKGSRGNRLEQLLA
ncbi:MAG: cyanophycin synthetase, partial [Bacteroidota bacterium]